MRQGLNKIVEDGMRAKHERREGILQIYRDLKNYYYGKKAKKLIAKKQKELADNLSHTTNHNKDISAIETLMQGTNITGELLYDWDAKDGDRMNSGGGKFSRIIHSPLYKEHISNCEMELFKKHADDISGLILNTQPKRIIDMGGGDGQKTADILSLLIPAVIANINITTKDISPYLGEEFVTNITNWSTKSRVPVDASFMYENFLSKKELQSNKDKRMYIFSGGSIGQFEDAEITTIIQNMISDSVLGKRYILMTAFIAPEKDSGSYTSDINKLLATYGSPDRNNPYYNELTHKTIEDWVMSGLHHHLGTQVKDKLVFDVHYEDQGDIGGRVILGATVIEPFSITVGNKTYSKQVGDYIPTIQSRRFSKKHLLELIENAGCSIDAFDKEGGVGQVLFHTPSINLDNITSEKLKSWRKTAQLFGAGALLVGGMVLGNQWSDYKKQKQQEERRRQDVNRVLGNTQNMGYGPTASGIESGWNTYSEYLKDIYGVQDVESLKYDFLSRYVQAYKRGEIYYGGRMGGHTEPIVLIDKYITENKLRIKFDKGIEFSAHKELQDKEDIMRATLQAADSISYGGIGKSIIPENYDYKGLYTMYGAKTTEYKKYRMKEGYLLWMEYIFQEIEGKTYILARRFDSDNKNTLFTVQDAKTLIQDYFTPIGASDISDHFGGLVENSNVSPESIYIQDKITQFAIQGYNFDYSIFANDDYNMKSYYFLQTFFPELKVKDTLTINYNLREDIDLVVDELIQFDYTIGLEGNTKYLANIESSIFNNMIVDMLSPGFFIRKDNKRVVDKKAFKERIVRHSDKLPLKQDIFPFQDKYFCDDIRSTIGYISHTSEDYYGGANGLYFDQKGTYTTKDNLLFARGYIQSSDGKHLVAQYLGDNNNIFKDSHIQDIEDRYFAKGHYGWGEREQRILAEGKNKSVHTEQYNSIIEFKKECRNTARSILNAPNSYFANIIYQDWLER